MIMHSTLGSPSTRRGGSIDSSSKNCGWFDSACSGESTLTQQSCTNRKYKSRSQATTFSSRRLVWSYTVSHTRDRAVSVSKNNVLKPNDDPKINPLIVS